MRVLLHTLRHRAKSAILVAGLLAWAGAASAEALVVIVNPASGIERMTRAEVAAVFMGRSRRLASGVTALPLDLSGNSAERVHFYDLLLGKTLPEVNSYWARLLFTGRASPPQQVASAAEIVTTVAANKSAIGYVPRSKADSRVRIVLELAP